MNRNTGSSRLVPLTAVLPRATLTHPGSPEDRHPARAGNRPLVLGHRGVPGPNPAENTVQAVHTALTRGADGAEIDVRLTADGILLCSHDETIATRTGDQLPISTSTAAAAQHAAAAAGTKLATLPQMLAAAAAHPGCQLVVEAKPVATTTAAHQSAHALHAALTAAAPNIQVTVSSFDPNLLNLIRATTGPNIHTALLGHAGTPAHTHLRTALDAGHDQIHLNIADLHATPHIIDQAHHLGVAVTAWTANTPTDLQWAHHHHLDAVITDDITTALTTITTLTHAA